MLKKTKRTASQPKPPSHDELRSNIRLQTEDFLKLGGIIQRVPNGASGYAWKPSNFTKTNKKQA